ncbi:MAG: hypothetical protein EXX96DRAFT_579122 [Benjaminiella poitrasii]|nr:MAG: hypothetical protein EXX96DRAFT_579122 [Benjaminiella poitrasii]
MIEGKAILDSITKKCSFTFKEAKKIKIVNLQISGLKTILVLVKYAKDQNGYVAQTTGQTIMFPTALKYLENFFKIELLNLIYWKDRAEKNLEILQDGLNKDNSNFGGSDQSDYNPSFIEPTWLGPKATNSEVIPPLPHLTF